MIIRQHKNIYNRLLGRRFFYTHLGVSYMKLLLLQILFLIINRIYELQLPLWFLWLPMIIVGIIIFIIIACLILYIFYDT